MASRGGHLDATGGREVVYCHRCEHEWYRDEHADTLSCPECRGEITEIVSPDNDPRNIDGGDSLSDFERRHHHYHDTDSDPDEEDIEEHIARGPGGFFGRRNIHRFPEHPNAGNRPRANPDNSEDIIRRFTEMLGDIGGPAPVGRSGPETLFANSPGSGPGIHRVTHQRFTGPGFTGGVSSFTITTGGGSGRVRHAGGPGSPVMGDEDPFQRIFGNILGGIGPPPMDRNDPQQPDANAGNRGGQPGDLAMALNQLFASVLNPNAVQGDAVYSQEALDRIITNLMEANPQSNAAAPASEQAIAKLPRKKLDEEMLGPELKGECTICIDDLNVGDEVLVLPWHPSTVRLPENLVALPRTNNLHLLQPLRPLFQALELQNAEDQTYANGARPDLSQYVT